MSGQLAQDVDYLGEKQSSPRPAPLYVLHRDALSAIDGLPATLSDIEEGIVMAEYRRANIQVVPDGTANPTVQILWWSDVVGHFVPENADLVKAGIGAALPYEFSVECNSRRMLVRLSALAGAGDTSVYVSGSVRTDP